MILDFAAEDNFPWYPQTTGEPPTPGEQPNRNEVDGQGPDKGIVAYAIQLSEVWFKITRYARRRGKPSSLPPWSSQSEYTTILAHQMDFETRMPFKHRFEPAKFSQRSVEHLNSNRDYWGPWLFIQFLYHTNLCLLNHPLLLSLRLRNFKCVIPEIFLQHTSDLILSHASWIINFIDMLEAKPFRVTDPFLGHCVAIIATIYLQESLADDPGTRREKQDNFDKCLKFILGFGQQWPHLERIVSIHSMNLISANIIRQANFKILPRLSHPRTSLPKNLHGKTVNSSSTSASSSRYSNTLHPARCRIPREISLDRPCSHLLQASGPKWRRHQCYRNQRGWKGRSSAT